MKETVQVKWTGIPVEEKTETMAEEKTNGNGEKRITLEDILAKSKTEQELKAQGDEQLLSRLEEKLFQYGSVDTQEVMDGLRSVLDSEEDEDSD